MLFNSIHFLVFLPIVLLGVAVLPGRWRNPFLLAASYYFYMRWKWEYVILLVVQTLVTYEAGRRIGTSRMDSWTRRWAMPWQQRAGTKRSA